MARGLLRMQIPKMLTDTRLYVEQKSSPSKQTDCYPNEECVGLKLDMLTLYSIYLGQGCEPNVKRERLMDRWIT